ncbi:MAG: gliding motility-associated C-terminal domain-containing protein [Spirosomataceae bacterium]
MRKIFLFFLLVFICLNSFASHIVGGEIEIKPFADPSNPLNTHRIQLNLYFDENNGRPEAEDVQITVAIYRRRDNNLMGNVILQRVFRDNIKYLVPGCEKGDLKTLLISYANNITLSAETYNDPQGYYVVWERCCRNAIINNILNPSRTGMVFFTEFPAVTTKNSSPVFKPVVADYICAGQSFEIEFNASDADGDSLVYSLITPWSGFTGQGNPNAFPRGADTYPEVNWVTGINVNNMIPGEEPLNITYDTGILSVTTDKVGLYVFSIFVEEFRNGKRIGRVKRDFQLKVMSCNLNNAPSIRVKNLNDNKFYAENQLVTLKEKDNRCFEVSFSDKDISQKIKVSAKAVNFDSKRLSFNAPVDYTIKSNNDTLKLQFCLDNCAVTRNGLPIEVQLAIEDNGCPVPIYRRFILRIQQEQNVNNRPELTSDLPSNNVAVDYGKSLSFNAVGTEVDGDSISITARGRGFNFADVGLTFTPKSGFSRVLAPVSFNPNCEAVRKGQLFIDFTITESRCGILNSRSYTVLLNVKGIPNTPPKVTSSLSSTVLEYVVSPYENKPVTFNVFADDDPTQTITLGAQPSGFTLNSAEMFFDNKSGRGKLTSPFGWEPSCKLLDGQDTKEYFVKFVSQDNSCYTNNRDSLIVKLVLKDQSVASVDLKPYNVFTPNGDGVNDYFTLGVIPGDNCKRQFQKFEVFNRWGKIIYLTIDRNFKWDGGDYASGDYFYAIHYSDEVKKGILTLIK